ARVSANARMSGVPAGHQAATRGRADGASGIALSEAHSFLRQPIYVRSPNLLLAVAAEVAITKVVRQNENDVGFVRRSGLEPAEIRSLLLGEDQAAEAGQHPGQITKMVHDGAF